MMQDERQVINKKIIMSITAQLFIVWLNPQAGKIKGILCSDWPPEIGPIACSVFLVLALQEKVPSLLFYLISLFFLLILNCHGVVS